MRRAIAFAALLAACQRGGGAGGHAASAAPVVTAPAIDAGRPSIGPASAATRDAGAAGAALAIEPLVGPFAALADYCVLIKAPATCDAAFAGLAGGPERIARPAAPYRELRFVATGDGDGGAHCHLAVRLSAGWFVHASGLVCQDPPEGAQQSWRSIYDLAVRDVQPGGAPEIVVGSLFTDASPDRGASRDVGEEVVWTSVRDEVLLCGVGPTGTPSCAEPIVVALGQDGDHTPPPARATVHRLTEWESEATLAFAADRVTITATKRASDELFALERTGAFALRFP